MTPRCPLAAALAPHRRGTGERPLDALALAWAGGPTLRERHAAVMAHLRERPVVPAAKLMRLRCPQDSAREADRHLAVDVRLPLSLDAIPKLMRALGRCPCGAALVIDTRPEVPDDR